MDVPDQLRTRCVFTATMKGSFYAEQAGFGQLLAGRSQRRTGQCLQGRETAVRDCWCNGHGQGIYTFSRFATVRQELFAGELRSDVHMLRLPSRFIAQSVRGIQEFPCQVIEFTFDEREANISNEEGGRHHRY